MKRSGPFILFVLGILGLLDALYLSYEHIYNIIPPCTLGAFADCGKVLQSVYSRIFGVPVAYIGVAQYSLLLLVLVFVIVYKNKFANYLAFALSTIGFLGSMYFVYLQLVVINAICIYCMTSAIICFTVFAISYFAFARERVVLTLSLFGFFYKYLIKQILFKLDPEEVHTGMVEFGEFTGSNFISKNLVKSLFTSSHKSLEQDILGMHFKTPIGLAAGFDYEARLTQVLPSWDFGFQTIGTITNSSYKGNPKPLLGRLPRSKSLMVNKGFKNLGAKATIKKLKGLEFQNLVGISIGRTNSLKLKTQKQSIDDIVTSFKLFERAKLPNSYYELNISCPNLFGKITFYPPKNLEALLKKVDELKISKPIFVKMPIEKSDKEVLEMLSVIARHCPAGVIFGNLQKDRNNPAFVKDEVDKFKVGNFSGKPTFDRSNELISLTYKKYKKRFMIIGCGGVFSGRDAYEKIIRGASVVQLITGLIFEGPQLVSSINFELEELLVQNKFKNIKEAVGSKKVK